LSTILVVDDDPQLRQSFQRLLTDEGHDVLTAATGEKGISVVRDQVPDLVIMDVRLPGMDGLQAFQAMRQIEPKLPVIVMTAFGTTDTAIEATKLGAFDFVLKPFDIPEILTLIGQAIDAGRFTRVRVEMDVSPDMASSDAIVGRTKPMQELYKSIGRVAPTDATVLIRGESGTGKELVARAVYHHSLRAEKPFLVINCVAIPETLLESELFGYEKGAFTGAVSRRVGKIQQAHHGTVFLDEIGDMPLSIQAKILRLLQEKSIERLGGRDPIPVDVRILAATNRDLESAVAAGKFREDLYYRLKVVTLSLPPLRERLDDIPLLVDYFLARFTKDMGLDNHGMSKDAKAFLCGRTWPGNVRELANTLQKTLIFSRGGPINLDAISQVTVSDPVPEPSDDMDMDKAIGKWIQNNLTSGTHKELFNTLMDRFGKILIGEALKLTGNNRTRAARLLGISRPTLLSKIEKYGLKIETSVKSEPNV
jgi:DNA-binding NtrC family response regulator